MIYYACRYAPVELFAGFGEEMARLDPSPKNFECSDNCAHPNLCGFSKAVIEEVNRLKIRELVLTDCCDAMRRTYDVLKMSAPVEFIYLLPLPHKEGPAEVRLFADELEALKDAWEEYSGKHFDVKKAILAYRKAREEAPAKPAGAYVSLAGAHGGKMLCEMLKSVMGDIPVVDDTCTGNRRLTAQPGTEENFFRWYAAALLSMEPCMRMLAAQQPAAEAKGTESPAPKSAAEAKGTESPAPEPAAEAKGTESPAAEAKGTESTAAGKASAGRLLGTVFHTMKFCDYYSFRYMDEKDTVSVPLVKIETDTTRQSGGQLKTRLDAFREELGIDRKEVRMMKKDGPLYTAGIDSGSTSTDAVIMDENRKILGRAIIPTGAGAAGTAQSALEKALTEAGLSQDDLTAMVSTGYGRETIGVDSTSVTEITCHARGANFINPAARTVIDIGGQDSKVILIDGKGSVQNFVMNDKCAAGTGRFLEMQARALGMSMEEMSRKGLEWKNDVEISSMCTVFAESEVVSLVAQNIAVADIIHGLNKSVAAKTASLVKRLGGSPEFIMTGGVAQNAGVVRCLEEKLGSRLFISEDAQLCGAIGAALIALESVENGRQ